MKLIISAILTFSVLVPTTQAQVDPYHCQSLLAYYRSLQQWIQNHCQNGNEDPECLVAAAQAFSVWQGIQIYCPPGTLE